MFVPVLHLRVRYEFIMGNKHEVKGLKAKKLWGRSPLFLALFVVFSIKKPHFEAYLSLNFNKNPVLSL